MELEGLEIGGMGERGVDDGKEGGREDERNSRETRHKRHKRVLSHLSLEGDGVRVVGTLQNLAKVATVEAEGDVAVAPKVVEAVGAEGDGAEGDVGAVHGLDAEALLGAVNVGVGDEVLREDKRGGYARLVMVGVRRRRFGDEMGGREGGSRVSGVLVFISSP